MREDGGDLEATRALDVHEKRAGLGDDSLELVLTLTLLGGGVEEIDSQSLFMLVLTAFLLHGSRGR